MACSNAFAASAPYFAAIRQTAGRGAPSTCLLISSATDDLQLPLARLEMRFAPSLDSVGVPGCPNRDWHGTDD